MDELEETLTEDKKIATGTGSRSSGRLAGSLRRP
jgi:hypothetical protein